MPSLTSTPFAFPLTSCTPLEACNGGLFISSGSGSHPERIIDSWELILMRSGVLRLWEEERQFELGPGDALVLWPARRHGPLAPYEPDTSFYWTHFRVCPDGSPSGAPTIPQFARLSEPLRLVELFHRFLDDQERARLEPNYASVLLKLMLLEVAAQSCTRCHHDETGANLAALAQVVITKRFREPITTSSIAGNLRCNPDYLGRVYRETFGHTLTQAIHRSRMQHARNLLLLTSLSVKQISAACGFETSDYFRRLFRRYYGMQPVEFRTLHLRQHTNAF
ncbi:MAG: AraC family transcriptional regulator [Verrucomicrobia bacterium]|nr:AraC family transcriptional regulator [Verrucomicrobiota bacterium]